MRLPRLFAAFLHPFIRPQPIAQSLVLLAIFVACGILLTLFGADQHTVVLGPLSVWLHDTGLPPVHHSR